MVNSVLEMTQVTVRKSAEHPYGELKPCPDCPARLLPFVPGALVHAKGQRLQAANLQDGQVFMGTVFIRNKPIDSISEIVDKQ